MFNVSASVVSALSPGESLAPSFRWWTAGSGSTPLREKQHRARGTNDTGLAASRPRLWCRFGVSGSKIWVRSACDENEHFDSPNHEVHSFQPHTYHHIAANARWPFRCSECVLIVCLCACTNVYACLRTCNICICNLFLKICFRLSYMLFEYMHTFK